MRQDGERPDRLREQMMLEAHCSGQDTISPGTCLTHPWGCQEQIKYQGMIPGGHIGLGHQLPLHAAFPFQLHIMPLQLKCNVFIPFIIYL